MDDPEMALLRAAQLLELGRASAALDALPAALASPTTADRAHLLVARCHLALGDPKRAQQAAAQALAHEPNNAQAHLIIGSAQLAQNYTRRAVKSAREASRLDPWSVYAQYLLVRCWLKFGLGYRGRARTAGSRAVEIGPHSALAFFAAGLAASGSGSDSHVSVCLASPA